MVDVDAHEWRLDSWLADVRDHDDVDQVLGRIAERAVLELAVEMAVARARAQPGAAPGGQRRSAPSSAGTAVPPVPGRGRARRVSTRTLALDVWTLHQPQAGLPYVLLLDLGHHDVTRHARGLDGRAPPPPPAASLPGRRPVRHVGDRGAWLELHSHRDLAEAPERVEAAADFAVRASLLLVAVERVSHLRHALETRALISQAQGVLMERYGLDTDRAIALLRRLSQSTHRRVRDLASEIVARETGTGERAGTVPWTS